MSTIKPNNDGLLILKAKLLAVLWLLANTIHGQDVHHTVDFQPNSYTFQSIGTNKLPPSIAGSFSPGFIAPFPPSTPQPPGKR